MLYRTSHTASKWSERWKSGGRAFSSVSLLDFEIGYVNTLCDLRCCNNFCTAIIPGFLLTTLQLFIQFRAENKTKQNRTANWEPVKWKSEWIREVDQMLQSFLSSGFYPVEFWPLVAMFLEPFSLRVGISLSTSHFCTFRTLLMETLYVIKKI